MQEKLSALLVHHHSEPLRSLRLALEGRGIATVRARSCREARQILSGANPPPLVFTDTTLPDGVWTDVLALAGQAPQPVNVIVVARLVDTHLYVRAIEAGAFDFLAPPFLPADLAHVVRCAADNVLERREAQGRSDALGVGRLFPVPSIPITSSGTAPQTATPSPTRHPAPRFL